MTVPQIIQFLRLNVNVQNPDGSVRITKTTKVTGKGQVYFVNKFLNGSKSEGM